MKITTQELMTPVVQIEAALTGAGWWQGRVDAGGGLDIRSYQRAGQRVQVYGQQDRSTVDLRLDGLDVDTALRVLRAAGFVFTADGGGGR